MDTSTTINAIIPALILAKDMMGKVALNSVNPHFKSKYADFNSLLEAAASALALNNLVIVQMPSQDAIGYYVETTLYHTSGEFLSGKTYINPTKNDPQGLGSAITYAKRYGFGSLLGLNGEPDDDGNAASVPVDRVYKPQPTTPAKSTAASPPTKPSGSTPGLAALDALFGKPAGVMPAVASAKAMVTSFGGSSANDDDEPEEVGGW